MSYCIVDGKPCTGSFCCKECEKYHNYISLKTMTSQPPLESVDELEFEEEAFQDINNNLGFSTGSLDVSASRKNSASSVYSMSSGLLSAEPSPLLTPKDDVPLQDIKFNSLFDNDNKYKKSMPQKPLPQFASFNCLDTLNYYQQPKNLTAMPQNSYKLWVNQNL